MGRGARTAWVEGLGAETEAPSFPATTRTSVGTPAAAGWVTPPPAPAPPSLAPPPSFSDPHPFSARPRPPSWSCPFPSADPDPPAGSCSWGHPRAPGCSNVSLLHTEGAASSLRLRPANHNGLPQRPARDQPQTCLPPCTGLPLPHAAPPSQGPGARRPPDPVYAVVMPKRMSRNFGLCHLLTPAGSVEGRG